jgi:hypothetical protein
VNPGAHEGFKSRKGVNPGAHEGFKSRRGVNPGAHEGFKTRKGVNPGAHEGFKSISIFFTSMKIYHCLLDFVNLQKNCRNKDKNSFTLNTHT